MWHQEVLLLLRREHACRELPEMAARVYRVGVQSTRHRTSAAAAGAVLLLLLHPMVSLLLQPGARPCTCPELLLLLPGPAFVGAGFEVLLEGTPCCPLLLPAW
jgi:hypothetical protein